MNTVNRTAPESNTLQSTPDGRWHPLVRPDAVGWWWVYHCRRWRCGRVIEDWNDNSGSDGLIWSDGGCWYSCARINIDLMTGTHWFPATPPDWTNNKRMDTPQ